MPRTARIDIPGLLLAVGFLSRWRRRVEAARLEAAGNREIHGRVRLQAVRHGELRGT